MDERKRRGTAGGQMRPSAPTALPGTGPMTTTVTGAPGALGVPPHVPGAETAQTLGPSAADAMGPKPVNEERIREFDRILSRYRAGKKRLERRIIRSENWWKLRNSKEEDLELGRDSRSDQFRSASGWLHNVIVSKHADAMEAYPEPIILPREREDAEEASRLSAILPVILENNDFEQTYSDAMWQKLKTGTACYKVIWDKSKMHGIGDIAIERVNLLNLFWEPGIEDIQKSRYVFQTHWEDTELLKLKYPQAGDRIKRTPFQPSEIQTDDAVTHEGQTMVVEVYYHIYLPSEGGPLLKRLQYCAYAGDTLLYASENDEGSQGRESYRTAGFYRHGRYPFVLDPLFPIEGSPAGYGFVDICKNPQTAIDLMRTALVKNTLVGATPRYFKRGDTGTVNEEELLDLSKTLVHVTGNVDEAALRQISVSYLSGNHINMMNEMINELRETSGNTETATGSTSAGVTAASAIAALQEASGKGSRDSTTASYRAYAKIVWLCVELAREFYTMPRQFRIVGADGAARFIEFSNEKMQRRAGSMDFGQEMDGVEPVYDIKIKTQKRNAFTRLSQNELAMQLYKLGMFNPQAADAAQITLGMMDFEGKDELQQKLSAYTTEHEKLVMLVQLTAALCQQHQDLAGMQTLQQILNDGQGKGAAPTGGGEIDLAAGQKENTLVTKARERSNNAAMPGGAA